MLDDVFLDNRFCKDDGLNELWKNKTAECISMDRVLFDNFLKSENIKTLKQKKSKRR